MGSTAILEKSLEGVDLHVASQLIELILVFTPIICLYYLFCPVIDG